MKKIVLRIVLLSITTLIITCTVKPPPRPAIIRIKGSDTMRILLTRLTEVYMDRHPTVSVYVEGGGTASGVDALISGRADICAASRPLRPQEAGRLARKYSSVGVSFKVAKDALSIYVNPENPVKDLTLKQLKQIFTGEIKNWQAVGGPDQKIQVVSRPPNSGTYFYFKSHIMEGGNYTPDAEILPTTQQIVDRVLQNPGAVGYGGIAYGPPAIHCRVNGIPPSAENVRYDLYPISRYLYLYTVYKPRDEQKAFIDWVLGSRGQQIVKKVGYISLFD